MANKFFDFSATNNGDGTAANQAASGGAVGAFNTVVGVTFVVNDVCWFRRTSTALTLSSVAQTFTIANVSYIGWPIFTDIDYTNRPTSGITNGWDADSTANLPTITYSGTTTIVINSGINQNWKRFKFNDPTNANHISVQASSTGGSFINCTFTSGTAATITNAAVTFSVNAGTPGYFYNCTFQAQGSRYNLNVSVGTAYLYDCIFTKTSQAVGGSILAVLFGTGVANAIRCTFTTLTAGAAATNAITATGTTGVSTFIDCTLDNSIGNAGSEYNFVSSGKCLIRNMNVKGTGVSLTQTNTAQLLHFSNITQTYNQNTGALQIATAKPGIIVVDNFVPKAGNTTDLTTVESVLVLINNGQFMAATPITGSQCPGVYVSSYGGVLGAFKYFGPNGNVISTTAVTRTGGSAISLKFTNTGATYPAFTPLDVSRASMETIFASLSAGARTVTLYGGYTTFTTAAPTAEDIWFEMEYLDQSTGAHSATKSCRISGTLTSDTSSWVGATLTKFKLVISATAGQACLAPIRIHSKYLDATGLVYLDPTPVVI